MIAGRETVPIAGICPPLPREVLEWPYTAGGGGLPPWTPPPLQTKGTIEGKTEISNRGNLVPNPLRKHCLLQA